MRGVIATANYGLAVIWYSSWHLQPLAVGEPIGTMLLYSMNDSPMINSREIYRTIIGDPTLRLNTVAPPLNVTGTRYPNANPPFVFLSWTAGESGSKYHVYSSASANGPFTRLTPSAQTAASWYDYYGTPGTQNVYMVRALKVATTGSGSYTNISHGTFKVVPY